MWSILCDFCYHSTDPPEVKVPGAHISINEQSTAVLSCTGFSVPLPHLAWSRADGQEITGHLDQSIATGQDGREMITLKLRLDNATSSLDGVFVCVGKNNVTNLLNSPDRAEVILTVLGKDPCINTSIPYSYHMLSCSAVYISTV